MDLVFLNHTGLIPVELATLSREVSTLNVVHPRLENTTPAFFVTGRRGAVAAGTDSNDRNQERTGRLVAPVQRFQTVSSWPVPARRIATGLPFRPRSLTQ